MRRLSLLPILLFLAGPRAVAQTVSLELSSDSAVVDACPGAEIAIDLRLVNPGRLAVGGFQLFLRYSAAHVEPLRYEAGDIGGSVVWNAPQVEGGGFRPCTGETLDPWGDLAGEDMFVVLANVYGEAGAAVFTGEAGDLGKIIFASRGVPSGEAGVAFRPNESACHVPLEEIAKVFGPSGEELSLSAAPASLGVRLLDGGPAIRSLTCLLAETGTVRLEWIGPAQATAIDGYRVYRNGEVISAQLLPFVSNFEDPDAPAGLLRYEVAVLHGEGEVLEGCRAECKVERQSLFRRGYVDSNSIFNVTDVVVTLAYLFQGGTTSCLDAADFDDTGEVNLTDALAMLRYLFEVVAGEKLPPPPPFAQPGPDPTADDIGCE